MTTSDTNPPTKASSQRCCDVVFDTADDEGGRHARFVPARQQWPGGGGVSSRVRDDRRGTWVTELPAA